MTITMARVEAVLDEILSNLAAGPISCGEDRLRAHRASMADAAQIDRLTRLTMQEYVKATWPDPADQERYFERNRLEPTVSTTLILSEDGSGEVVGRLTLGAVDHFRRGPLLDIAELHFLPDSQKKGFGACLLERVAELAAPLPLHLMVLEVNPARRLYERMGFKPIETDEALNPRRVEMLREA